MSLIDDITKFCEDLVLGDFEEEPSNAAMIVGGVISLIPVAQQVLNVRDMSGMIYRISRKGAPNCSKDDWVDLAMAAFGCIPELGSLFKTIVKPLWKERKLLKGALRGEAFVSGMLGKAKGKAITFVKTLDWAGNTQVAIQQMDNALTGCDQLLGELEQSHWWLPDSVQGLAHDLRPSLQTIRGPLHTGIQQGIQALQEFVTDLIGEDGYRVAQMAVAAASATSGSRSAGAHGGHEPSRPSKSTESSHPSAREQTPASRKTPPAEKQQAKHKDQQDTKRQQVEPGGGSQTTASRVTRAAWKAIGTRYKGLIGEHMAHYYHMSLHAPNAWPHGKVEEKHDGAAWKGAKRLVTEQNTHATPTELVPEHLARVNQNGVDGIWSLDGGVFHFVEAKASESAGALFGKAAEGWREDADGKRSTKIAPPSNLTERQYALWCMLSQPKKGLQMSRPWLRRSVLPTMLNGNEQNRYTYVFFAIPSSSPPKDYRPAAGSVLKKGVAPGIVEHVESSTLVGERLIMGGDVYDLSLHDKHKPTHGLSDQYSHEEIDELNDIFEREMQLVPAKTRGKNTPKPPSTRSQRTRNKP
ncbi:hypothetical protein [Ralstonia pseudosolanacearum]|uniref:hypothetical protein n=2 Tax=Ralstonia pseudosolanacearum TaxID=1310165 RepID=UPI000E56BB91|nr:hypothetical protein CJO83_03310 [Ralstonia solanacearum]BEU63456.1 hypothetical protein MAFF301524_32560 [Ralstonia pseudosolanacearum]AXW42164.1 hypothetical protein CJO90_03305 [Ralstonia solanacearum]AXW46863.1 hypothetical protein CJO91_03530 [Ralstonia solanacearum]AXW65474.1 hypothetical protein CJO95_03305 [Ralstonia solanacearum]